MALAFVSDLSVWFWFPQKRRLFRVVQDLELRVRHGEIVCVVGESGSGKSVTALAMMGLLQGGVVKGKLYFDGDWIELSTLKGRGHRFCGRGMSMVFQEPWGSLNPVQTVETIVSEPLVSKTRLPRRQILSKVTEALHKAGIENVRQILTKYPWELSGGLAQRVALAAALITDPKLLVADEPTTALDVTTQAQVLRVLQNLAKEGKSIILITHDLDIAMLVGDYVYVMYAGEVVEQGPAKQVLENPAHPYTRMLARSHPAYLEKEVCPPDAVMPQPWDRNTGCLFVNRCEFAANICKVRKPQFMQIQDRWKARCHMLER